MLNRLTAADFDRQKRRRIPVSLRGSLIISGELHPVRVVDLSEHGARVETNLSLRTGDKVTLAFAGWSPEATVRWARGGAAGLALAG